MLTTSLLRALLDSTICMPRLGLTMVEPESKTNFSGYPAITITLSNWQDFRLACTILGANAWISIPEVYSADELSIIYRAPQTADRILLTFKEDLTTSGV